MAISVISHNITLICVGYCSLHILAKFLCVTTPSLAAIIWKNSPTHVAVNRVHSSLYPALFPASKSPATTYKNSIFTIAWIQICDRHKETWP